MNSSTARGQYSAGSPSLGDDVLLRAIVDNLLDNLPDAVCVKDTEGRFLLCNALFARYHGFASPHLLAGKTGFDLRPGPEALQALAEEQALMRTGQSLHDREERWINPLTRDVITVKISKIPLILDNTACGLICIVRHVQMPQNNPAASGMFTARSPHGDATPIISQHELLRAMIDLLPVMIYAKDANSRFLACNNVVARNMGTTPQRLTGSTDFDFYPAHMAEKFYEDEQAIIRSGEPLIDREEQALDYASGVIRTLLTSKFPLRDASGTIIGIVGIGRDITEIREGERKQRELQQQLLEQIHQRERAEINLRLAQKLESVGQLAAGIAHEINTPIQFVSDSLYFLRTAFADLNGLLNTYRETFARVMAGTAPENVKEALAQAEITADIEFLNEEVPRAFERTFNGAERVASIVGAMREFAHPDVKERSHADINHALQTTLVVATNEYKYLATVHTHFGNLPLVACNIGELNQVFLNLIVNAAHAIQDAGKDVSSGEIHVHTEAMNDTVVIRIRDNGCGIPAEHLDKIYDPFFTTKEVGRGTGQGLAITHSIVVDKHGGEISVNSTVGQGTEFVLQLPVDPGNNTIQGNT
ncbi:MAG TPA: PAS domain-containing protein [Steroidobacteraceae bacterium]|nr:PAS domain-containing protein [Steroidobacteraceae bacterium]